MEVFDACSFSWQETAWSACAPACGDSSMTRTVSCLRSDGTTMADTACPGGKPVESMGCVDETACSFHWESGPWSACAPSCGNSMMTCEVSCGRADGAVGTDEDCLSDDGDKPDVDQACESFTDCAYAWAEWAEWSSCPAACGEVGTATRTRACLRGDGADTVVDSAFCVAYAGGAGEESASCDGICEECRDTGVNFISNVNDWYRISATTFYGVIWDGVVIFRGDAMTTIDEYVSGGYRYYPKGSHTTVGDAGKWFVEPAFAGNIGTTLTDFWPIICRAPVQ